MKQLSPGRWPGTSRVGAQAWVCIIAKPVFPLPHMAFHLGIMRTQRRRLVQPTQARAART